MSKAEWAQVQSAFDTLAACPPKQRVARLKRLRLPPELADRLVSMLAAHDKAGMLDDGPKKPTIGSQVPEYSSLNAGVLIGGFRIDRLIGRGGMGEVYLAHREDRDFEQRVALKLLRPEVAQRFDLFSNERRTLAGLDHSGIARLIDGGLSPDGRPWMAMEYVAGQEINIWCADNNADLDTRLRLFLEICDAVSHAHARLIIHRDIKPANILVDAAGHARLLDFGVARLLDADSDARPATEALLTPHYAAPEQFDGGVITVATDIYGLAAVLFELLTGQGPWRMGDDETLPTILRRLLHDDPPLPSSVASDAIIPKGDIAGDLDAIISKAMRRLPADRYESVASLAEDLRRYLAFKPVLARSGSLGYETRRFIRRHRWTAAMAGAGVLALLIGTVGISWQARQTSLERDSARNEASRLEAVNSAMMLMFRDANDANRLETVTVNQMVSKTMDRILLPGSELSPDAPATVGALADLYLIVENNADAHVLLEKALARGIGKANPEGKARLKLKLGTILVGERRFNEARRLLTEANQIWLSDPVKYRREITETAGAEAYMMSLLENRAGAIALLTKNLPEAEQAYFAHSRDLVSRYAQLIRYLVEEGRLAQANAVVRRGQALLASRNQQRSGPALSLARIKAGIAIDQGNYVIAERILRQTTNDRRAIYGRSLELAVDLLHYGRLLNREGKAGPGLKALDEAEPMAIAFFGAHDRPVMLIRIARADSLIRLQRYAEAADILEAVEPDVRQYGIQSADYKTYLDLKSRIP